MIDPVGPAHRSSSARSSSERDGGGESAEGRRGNAEGENLPVPVGAVVTHEEPTPAEGSYAAFAAQLLGQPGVKRGLRGGPETLTKARSAYLGAEWSGPHDRRPPPGRITKTEI